jgi:hypothetical protein
LREFVRHERGGMCWIAGGLMVEADAKQWSKQSCCRRRSFPGNPEILNIVKIALIDNNYIPSARLAANY